MNHAIARLTALLVLLTGQVFADYCKWEDENGVTHYAETCPDDVQSTGVELQKPPSSKQIEDANRLSARAREKTEAKAQEAREEPPLFEERYTRAQILEQERRRHQRQCDQWRAELARLERKREWHDIQIDLKQLLHDNDCD